MHFDISKTVSLDLHLYDLLFIINILLTFGLGAVLYQEQKWHKHTLVFASRAHNKAQRNNLAAFTRAITEKFYDCLYGRDFTAIMDNNHLTFVLSSLKLDSTGHRWLAVQTLCSFNFIYIPEKEYYYCHR